jgi:colanic acid/amylovoran biosynthesis protein
MNILVVNGYTRQNKGDAALLSVLCHELQKSFPKATIKISSKEDPRVDPTFETWQNVGSLIQYCFLHPTSGKAGRLLRLCLSILAIRLLHTPRTFHPVIFSLLPQPLRLQLSALSQADLVVSMGGGYLNGGESLRVQGMLAIKMEEAMANASVYLMLAPLNLGKRFGARVVCAPQSMGPFVTAFQKKIVTKTLENIDLILSREKKTTALLAQMSRRFPVVQSVDSGFLFDVKDTTDLRRRLKVPKRSQLIGVTVRRWLDPKKQQAYEQAVAKTVDYLVSHHEATVVFIPQVTSTIGSDDDRTTSRNVYAQLAHKKSVHILEKDYTHQQIKALYNSLDMIIGTRFHSVIFSLTSLVPALAIEYEHKTSGIMHDLDLDDWVVKIEEATPEVLIRKIDELIAGKRHYKKHLARTLPTYIAKAREASTLIKQICQPDPSTM